METDVPLQREFEYYLANQVEIVKQYGGKFVVIKDQKVIGAYDDKGKAVEETAKQHDLGTFLVQKAEPGDQGHTQVFHSRVTFA